jgi:hypothetical protein
MVAETVANLTLFCSQEFLRRNVSVDQRARRIDGANHVYVYSFIIKNNEDVCVVVSRIEVPELRRNEVNSTEVRLYVEGSLDFDNRIVERREELDGELTSRLNAFLAFVVSR